MKLSIRRALVIVAVVDVVALLVSGVPRFKNAKHGLDAAVGTAAWACFLAGLVVLAALAGTAITRNIRARSIAAH